MSINWQNKQCYVPAYKLFNTIHKRTNLIIFACWKIRRHSAWIGFSFAFGWHHISRSWTFWTYLLHFTHWNIMGKNWIQLQTKHDPKQRDATNLLYGNCGRTHHLNLENGEVTHLRKHSNYRLRNINRYKCYHYLLFTKQVTYSNITIK